MKTDKSSNNTKIAAIQMASGPDVKANLMEAVRLIREAAKKGAQLVVLPESFALMAMDERENIDIAESLGEGLIQNTLSQCAKDNKVWVIAGSIPTKAENTTKVHTTSVVLDDKGKLVCHYHKIHLFDVDVESKTERGEKSSKEVYRESDTFEAGKDIVVIQTPFGNIGLSICYDMRFPMLYREMVKRGAQIILIPSAFTYATGKLHWETLIKARAIENQCYVLAPAQGGYHVNGRRTFGHAMAVDYLGQVQAIRLKGSGVITMNIDLEAQTALRKSFPVLQHATLLKS